MDAFNLFAKLTLDSSAYESGLAKAKSLASTVGGGLKTAMDVGIKAVAGATAAVGAFAATSVKTGMQFDSSMSQVAATMGQKANEMVEYDGKMMTASEALRQFALKEGRETAFSASQAADALNYMALAGYDATTSIQMLPNVLNLAAAGSFDLARASDMVTDTQSAFGISLERTTQMVDEMARASSTGNTSVEQLGDAFLTVGGLAQELNGGMVMLKDGTMQEVDGITELSIALTAMANAGVKGSEAGTHMRNMILKLSSPTSDGVKALNAMGVSVFDLEGKMRSLTDIFSDLGTELGNMTQEEKIQTISDLFNTRDLASAEALLGAVEGTVVKIGDETYSLGTAYEKFGDAIYDSAQGFEIVQSSWDEIGESILGASEAGVLYQGKLYGMEEAQEKFGDAIHDTEQGFRVLGAAEVMALTQLDNLEGDMTLFGSALEGVQVAISDVLTPTIREFVQDATTGLSSVAEAINKGDWSGAVNAISLFLTDALSRISAGIPDLINMGMQLLGALGQGIIDNIPQITNAAVQIIVMLVEGLVGALPQLAQGAMTLIESLGQAFSDNAGTLLQVGASILTMLWQGITEGLPILVDGAVELMGNLANYLQEAIPQLLPVALNAIMEFSGSLRENAGKLIDGALALIMALADGLIESLPAMIETIPTIVTNIAGIINDNAPKLLASGIELIGKLLAGIIEAVPTLIEEFPKIVEAIFAVITAVNWISLGTHIITFIGNGVKSLASSLPNLLKSIGQNASDFLKNIDWKGLGKTVIDFIVNGVNALMNDLPGALKSIGTTALEWVKGIDWLGLGKNVVTFIVNGVNGLINDIPNALKSIGTTAIEWVKGMDWLGLGGNIVAGIASGITDGAINVLDAVKGVAQSAWDAITGFFEVKSPSRKMAWLGEMLDEGMAKGITQNTDVVDNAMSKLETLPQIDDNTFASSSSMSTRNNNVIINVYGAQGQNVNDLAEIISRKINNQVNRRGAVWA